MEPMTIMAIAALIAEAAKTGVRAIQASTIYGKTERERYAELERLQQLSNLGYQTEELEQLQRQILDPQQAAATSRLEDQKQILQSGGTAADLSRALNKADKDARAMQAITTGYLTGEDIKLREARAAEMRALEKQKQAEQTALANVMVEGVGNMASEGLAAAGEAQQQRDMQTALLDAGFDADFFENAEAYKAWATINGYYNQGGK